MSRQPTRLGLIDGDIFAYRPAAATCQTVDWDDGSEPVQIATESVETASDIAESSIDAVMDRLKLDEVLVALSCPSAEVFRRDYWPSYKQARITMVRPLHLSAVKEHLRRVFPTIEEPRLEADDLLGILSTSEGKAVEKRVIVSIDKDMQTIPGWWFNPQKHAKPVRIDAAHAHRYHMLQTLTGDPVDGYPGAQGIGPKRAEKVLDGVHPSRLWDAVVEAYVRAYFKGEKLDSTHYVAAERMALAQARCAHILQSGDYNFNTKEVRPWTPRTST